MSSRGGRATNVNERRGGSGASRTTRRQAAIERTRAYLDGLTRFGYDEGDAEYRAVRSELARYESGQVTPPATPRPAKGVATTERAKRLDQAAKAYYSWLTRGPGYDLRGDTARAQPHIQKVEALQRAAAEEAAVARRAVAAPPVTGGRSLLQWARQMQTYEAPILGAPRTRTTYAPEAEAKVVALGARNAAGFAKLREEAATGERALVAETPQRTRMNDATGRSLRTQLARLDAQKQVAWADLNTQRAGTKPYDTARAKVHDLETRTRAVREQANAYIERGVKPATGMATGKAKAATRAAGATAPKPKSAASQVKALAAVKSAGSKLTEVQARTLALHVALNHRRVAVGNVDRYDNGGYGFHITDAQTGASGGDITSWADYQRVAGEKAAG